MEDDQFHARKGFCCRLNAIPGGFRMAFGVMMIAVGVPLFILPIPMGLFTIVAGLTLLTSAIPAWRQKLRRLKTRTPSLYKALKPFLDRCDRCPPQA